MLQAHRQKQRSNLSFPEFLRFTNLEFSGFLRCFKKHEIPLVFAKYLFINTNRILECPKISPGLIGELIAKIGKNSIDPTNDVAINKLLQNGFLTNEAKLEICVMLIES